MPQRRLVTVTGATGSEGGAVVRSLIETGQYKVRALTRDPNSEKSYELKCLSKDIEIVKCDTTNPEDVQHAFKDSWAIFASTDYWAHPNYPEIEVQQGINMANAAALLNIPYYIFNTAEDVKTLSDGKYHVPHFTQKAKICDYIKEKYPTLKTIYVEPAVYMQNWVRLGKLPKLHDGTVIFPAPLDPKTKLHLVDIDDTGPIVCEILDAPDKYLGQNICICGEEICFEDIPKVFTKVTGIPAIAKCLSEEEFREELTQFSKNIQDALYDMYKWFEEYGYYGTDKDWTNGQKITKLNTFEEWLQKTNWKGK